MTIEINPISGGGGGSVDSVNGQTGAVLLTTTNIPEGSNLYFTAARAQDLALAFSENIDPDGSSSNRNYLSTNLVPVADSSTSNINLLSLSISNSTEFPVNGFFVTQASATVDGSADQGFMGALQQTLTFGDGSSTQTLDQSYGTAYSLAIRSNATVNSVNVLSANTSMEAGSHFGSYRVYNDFSSLSDGDSFNGISFSPVINSLTSGYNSYSDTANMGDVGTQVTGFYFAPTIADVTNGITGIQLAFHASSANGCSSFDDASTITTQDNNFYGFNFHPVIGTSSGCIGINVNPTITSGTSYNGITHSPTIADLVNYGQGFYDGAHITTADNYTSMSLGPTIGSMSGYYNGLQCSPTIVGSTGFSAVGISVSMQNVTGFDAEQIHAIQTSGGRVSFDNGQIGGSYTLPVSDGGGNPTPVNAFNVNLTAAAGSTTANVDRFGFGPIMNLAMGAGATATSGPLGVGVSSLGMVDLLQLETGASIDHVTGSFVALVAPSGDGHIGNITGYRTVGARFGGTTTLDNFYGYFYDEPVGPWATTAWAFYCATSSAENWLAGHLKIGGTAGSTDRVTNSSCALEIEGGALRLANLTTAERDALTALPGMMIFNTDTSLTSFYNGAAWV